jgi:predicted DCC family thiol-disulfide oxidoreductase YuxK
MTIRAYLENPVQTGLAAGLALLGIAWRPAVGLAAVYFSVCEIVAGLRKSPGPRWLPAIWPRTDRSLVVLYDAECGLCARSKAHLETWATASSFRFVPLQSPEARALVPDLPEKEYLGAMHVIEGGRISSGAEGWLRILELGPLGWALLGWVAPRRWVEPVYGMIARNRYRWFGRVCEGGTCRVHPSPSGDRSSSSPSGNRDPSSAAP